MTDPTPNADTKPEGAKPVDKADDLDALLNEFTASPHSEPPAAAPPAKAPPAPTVKPLTPEEIVLVRRNNAQAAQRDYETAVSDTVTRMREHQPGLKNISDKLLKARLDVAVDDDDRIGKAFLSRHKNPQAWGKILKGVAEEIAQEMDAIPNPQNVTDREAAHAMAAGRVPSPSGASKVDNAALSKMTDAEFFASLPK